VALQTLPITHGLIANERAPHLRRRIEAVKRHSDSLRSAPDYMVNYWIMSYVAKVFPVPVMQKIMTSAHSTLAVSNLPGPQQTSKIRGHELKNLSFWIPNIGTTAIGLTLLTYGGRLQLGILADKAVIATEEDAHAILTGIVEEIKRMGSVLESDE
jgi:hypothetical protein